MIQQNEMPAETAASSSTFKPTETMLIALRQTRPWVRLAALLGFLYIFFKLISGIISMISLSEFGGDSSFIPLLIAGLINILVCLLFFFPILFLFRYAASIGRLLEGGAVNEMEQALKNQKSFWKFAGIVSLIMLVLILFGIIAAIIIPQFTQ